MIRLGSVSRLLPLLILLLVWAMPASGHGPKGHDTHAPGKPQRQAPLAEPAPDKPWVDPAEAVSAPQTRGRDAVADQRQETIDKAAWVEEKTGDFVPLDLAFSTERGEKVSLRQLIDRPTLLLPIYYRCPTGCSFELANLAEAIRRSSHDAGSFRAISLSFDADETPAIAAEVRPNYVQLLDKAYPSDAWVFLTGDHHAIEQLTRSIGYSFLKKDDATFIHASALIVLDKDGRIINYVYGAFLPGDVDLALAEAGKGTPASSIRRLLAFCLPANPQQVQRVLNAMKIASGVVLVVGGIGLALLLRRKPSDQPTFKP